MRKKKYWKITESNYDTISSRIVNTLSTMLNHKYNTWYIIAQGKKRCTVNLDLDIIDIINTDKYIRLIIFNYYGCDIEFKFAAGDKVFLTGSSLTTIKDGKEFTIVPDTSHGVYYQPMNYINYMERFNMIDGVCSTTTDLDISAESIYENVMDELDISEKDIEDNRPVLVLDSIRDTLLRGTGLKTILDM